MSIDSREELAVGLMGEVRDSGDLGTWASRSIRAEGTGVVVARGGAEKSLESDITSLTSGLLQSRINASQTRDGEDQPG